MMNRGRSTVVASIFASVTIGLTAGLVAQSGGASASTSSAHADTTALSAGAAPRFVLLGCDSSAEVAPSSISNCGDGAVGLGGLHWTGWNSHLASGYGTYFVNDCTPNCAAGHFQAYPALVDLWGSAAVKGHPSERKYTQMTLVFTGKRPPAYGVVNGKPVVTHPVTATLPTYP